MGIGYMCAARDHLCGTGFHHHLYRSSEHRLPAGEGKFAHHFNSSVLTAVIVYFCFNEDTVALLIVPYMHTKRLNTQGGGLNQRNRSEQSKRL